MGRKPKNKIQHNNIVEQVAIDNTEETREVSENSVETIQNKIAEDIPAVKDISSIETVKEESLETQENSDNEQLDYNNKISNIISELKQDYNYKFLSKVSLMKIAKYRIHSQVR